MSRKLNFICIGAQKAATTTLHDALKKHSLIYLPEEKEAKFFEEEMIYDKGYEKWYKENYSKAKFNQIIGLVNPELLFFSESAKRIKNEIGIGVKIIIVLRNPVDRAYSHFLMTKRRGLEDLSFEKALKQESSRSIKDNIFYKKHFSYIGRGRYFDQIQNYLKYFDEKNFLFLSYEEDIKKNLKRTLIKIQKFLNISIEPLDFSQYSNIAKTPRIFMINKLIFAKNKYLNFFVSLFLSKKQKKKFVKIIYNFNSKKILNNSIDISTKKNIMNKYFEKDYNKTLKFISENGYGSK